MQGAVDNPPDLSPLLDRMAAAEAALGQTPQFVSAAVMTVDQVLASFPAGPVTRGKYVRVSDYAGGVDRVLRYDYEASSGLYFLTPTTPDYARSIALTGNMTLLRLKSPPIAIITGTVPLGTNRTVTIDLANARPGEVIEVRNSMASILGNLNILGTGIGSVLSNVLGVSMRFVVDSSSGSLQLVRL